MSALGDAYRWFDRFQQRHAALGFPLAVRQKYADDQGGYLAATIAYYGFFSIFPLLLVFVTVLGFALRGNPSLQKQVLGSALAELPVIGPQLQHNIHSLQGSALALGIGIGGALWAGTRVALAAENAMNHLWGVPFKHRPDPFRSRGRALLLLVVLGGAVLVSTGLSGLSASILGPAATGGGIALSFLVDLGLFWLAFRVLTAQDVGWRELLPGALLGAACWEALQLLGGYYVTHELKNASSTYGLFAMVIGLLSWLYLGAHVTLMCAEVNVVASRRLWPRSFSVVVEQPLTDADAGALRQRADVEERRQDEAIDVTFDEPRERQ